MHACIGSAFDRSSSRDAIRRRRDMGRADALVTYLNDAWTPYHAVLAACEALRARGYEELDERDAWSLRRGGKYFYTRNASACVAFAVGGGYEACLLYTSPSPRD